MACKPWWPGAFVFTMRSAMLWLIVLVGCNRPMTAGNVASRRGQLDRENRSRVEATLAEVARTRSLAEVTDLPPPAIPVAVRIEPTGEFQPITEIPALSAERANEPIIVEQEDGSLLLAVSSGCSGQSCECDVRATYRLARATDGKVIVIRVSYQVELETIKLAGTCSVGCGQPTPARPPSFHPLSVTRRDQVEIVDAKVRQIELVETCERPIGRP